MYSDSTSITNPCDVNYLDMEKINPQVAIVNHFLIPTTQSNYKKRHK